jgi:hypothetical protein
MHFRHHRRGHEFGHQPFFPGERTGSSISNRNSNVTSVGGVGNVTGSTGGVGGVSRSNVTGSGNVGGH